MWWRPIALGIVPLALEGCGDKCARDSGGSCGDTAPDSDADTDADSDVDTDAEPAAMVSGGSDCADTLDLDVEVQGSNLSSAQAYLVDESDASCVQGDGAAFADGYAGAGDCWEEVHSLADLGYDDASAAWTWGVALEITDDFEAAQDGVTLFGCDIEIAMVFAGVDSVSGEGVCLDVSDDLGVIADAYACAE